MSRSAIAVMRMEFMAFRLCSTNVGEFAILETRHGTGEARTRRLTWRGTRHTHSLKRHRHCVPTQIKFHTAWEDPVNCCNNYTILPLSQLWYSSALNFGENAQAMSLVRLFLCRSIGANNAHWRTGLPLLYITNTVWRNVGQGGTELHR
jgi:hypothetical protein